MKKVNWKTALALVVVVGLDIAARALGVPVPPGMSTALAGAVLALFPTLSPALVGWIATLTAGPETSKANSVEPK